MTTTPTVAVITSTIGRSSLLDTIDCIKKQSYPCRHYVFVDGEQHHQAVKKMVKAHPEIVVTYLPVSTGATGLYNSAINAIAPFIATEDIICFLDDDNTVTTNHVEQFATNFSRYKIDYAYSLRNFYLAEDKLTFPDNLDSLGFWISPSQIVLDAHFELNGKIYRNQIAQIRNNPALIDVNCMALKRELAQQLASTWMQTGYGNDRNITQALLSNSEVITGLCTSIRTVNYTMHFDNFVQPPQEVYNQLDAKTNKDKNIIRKQLFLQYMEYIDRISQDCRPWETPTIFKNGQLYTHFDDA